MYEDAIVLGIIFGFTTVICFIGYKLIRLKLLQGTKIEEDAFNRLAKAFTEHKKDTQRRLQNLEAIISDDGSTSSSSRSTTQIEAPRGSIEIEDRDTEKAEKKAQPDSNNRNLRNMLRE